MNNPFEEINQNITLLSGQLESIANKISYTNNNSSKTVLTLPELAKYLGFSHQTIYRMVSRNEITYSKIGGKLFFKMEDIIHYLDKNRIESQEKIF